jgi:PAS domain S-box-containing protein
VTVQNTGFCIAAFLTLIGVLIALSGTAPRRRPGDALKISILYGGCVVAFCFFAIAAVFGAVPPFFIQSTGFTALREFIITSAIEFFVLAAGVLLWLYYKKREEFFFWYSIGMALIGIGLLAVHFPSVLGSPLGWVGRSAQYLGGVYFLIAFIALSRSAQRTGISLSDMLSWFFGEAETSYRTLIETATDAIAVFDSADRVIVWNRAAENMFGYTSVEATGASFFQIAIPDEFTDVIKSNFRSSVTLEADSSVNKSVEMRCRRKDGSTFPVELALSRHMVAGTWVSTCIMRDLTERKREEEALQNNIRLLEDVMDSSTSPIFLKDLEGKFISINSPLEKMLGKSRQEMKGKTDYDIAPKELADYWRSHDKKVLDTGKAIQVEEVADLPAGQYVFLSNKFPLVDTHGEIYGVGAISQDITDRKQAEQELIQKNEDLSAAYEEITSKEEELNQNLEELTLREEELSRALAEKEVLLSEIHHRVKNNLTAFISLLSLEGAIDDTPEGKQLKLDLQNRARSMALVHETLYRTHLYDEVDMGVYLTNLLDQIANSFTGTRSVKTVVDTHGVMLDIPRATPAGLIINELVTNSFKYAFPDSFDVQAVRNAPPTITIGLAKRDNTYVMTFKDNGVGLPSGLDLTKTQSLGLKLVNFLGRHQMRANIEVNSTAGTEFVFRFKEATKK